MQHSPTKNEIFVLAELLAQTSHQTNANAHTHTHTMTHLRLNSQSMKGSEACETLNPPFDRPDDLCLEDFERGTTPVSGAMPLTVGRVMMQFTMVLLKMTVL